METAGNTTSIDGRRAPDCLNYLRAQCIPLWQTPSIESSIIMCLRHATVPLRNMRMSTASCAAYAARCTSVRRGRQEFKNTQLRRCEEHGQSLALLVTMDGSQTTHQRGVSDADPCWKSNPRANCQCSMNCHCQLQPSTTSETTY